jgi:uncharacterized membrane protein YkoI
MEAAPTPNNQRRRWIWSAGLVGSGLVAGAILAGTLSAGAQSNSPTPTATSTSGKRGGSGETALTGTTAEKVRAAALAAVPGGTILRVETDSDGSPYEAHVRKPDGTEVTVKVDEDFKVTGIETHRGHRGRGAGETPLTGTTAEKVTAAAQAAVPGGTILRVETDSDGSPYEAHVQKSDGTEVTVKVDKDFKVTGIETHDGTADQSA